MIFSSTSIAAQISEKFEIGIQVNSGLNFQSNEDPRIFNEEGSSLIEGGLIISYDINNRFQMKLNGLFSFQKFTQLDYRVGVPLNSSPDIALDFENNFYAEEKFKQKFIGLGVESKFNFSKKENHVYGKIGFDNMFNTRTNLNTKLFNSPTEDVFYQQRYLNTFPKKFFLHIKSGIGCEFEMGNNLEIFIELQGRYSVTRPLATTPSWRTDFKPRVYDLSFNVGVMF